MTRRKIRENCDNTLTKRIDKERKKITKPRQAGKEGFKRPAKLLPRKKKKK